MPQPPPSFVIGNPVDDPGCDLLGYLYPPDPVNWGNGPHPAIIATEASGFIGGGPGPSDFMLRDLAKSGYLCMFFDVRLVKLTPNGGLPGQTTDGKWSQQTDDCQIGMRYMRAHPLCNGFVAMVGGSGSAGHAVYMALTGIVNDTRPDAVISLSGMVDASNPVGDFPQPIIEKVVRYYRTSDLTLLRARSPIAFVNNQAPPIYFANGMFENMPFSVYTSFKAAMDAVPLTNYVSHVNVLDGGVRHAWGTWPENADAGKVFLVNAVAAWNGGGGGGQKPQPVGLYDLVSAPGGNFGDLTGRSFLTNPSIEGVRIRTQWQNVQLNFPAAINWTLIDNAFAVCTAAGRKIGMSVIGGCGTPAGVYTTAPTCTKFTLSPDDVTLENQPDMPIPWQPNFLAKWQTFVNALGARYDSNPFLAYICVTGFMQNVGMGFVGTTADLTRMNAQAVLDGYANTAAGLLFAGKAIIDIFATAFPTTSMLLTIDDPFPGGGATKLAIRDYGEATYPDRIGRMFTNLLAVLPPHNPPTNIPTYPNGFQPINPSGHANTYADPEPVPYPPLPQQLEDMLLKGWSNGGKYLEVYDGNVKNPDPAIQAVLAEVKALLVTGGGTIGLPFIASFLPTDGRPGDSISISGGNFTGLTSILIGGSPAGEVTYKSDTQITVKVAIGNVTGKITINTPVGQAVSRDNFTVLPPLPPSVPPSRTPILFYPIGGQLPLRRSKPGPPRNLIVTVSGNIGDDTAIASWTAPLSDGNSPITQWGASFVPGPGTAIISGPLDFTADIQDLPLDSDQTLLLTATNAYGTSVAATFDFRTNDAGIAPVVTEPRGIYRLLDVDSVTGLPIWDIVSAPFWTKAYIDGSRYEARWDILVPAYDFVTKVYTYNFADLDAYLDECDTYGKKAIISISNGIYAPLWLKAVTTRFTEEAPDAGTMPYPWDQTALRFWQEFIAVIGLRYKFRDAIIAIVAAGFGQVVDSVLAVTPGDGDRLTENAIRAGYANTTEGWLSVAQRVLTTCSAKLPRSGFVLTQLQFPTVYEQQGLTDLQTYVINTFRSRMGFMARGLNSISTVSLVKFAVVNNSSAAGFAAGYRLLGPSTDPNLDPLQDPNSFSPILAFTRALTKASELNGKFVEIFGGDADNVTAPYTTAITDARTALALNP